MINRLIYFCKMNCLSSVKNSIILAFYQTTQISQRRESTPGLQLLADHIPANGLPLFLQTTFPLLTQSLLSFEGSKECFRVLKPPVENDFHAAFSGRCSTN